MKTFTFKYDPSISLKKMFSAFKDALNGKNRTVIDDCVSVQSIDSILSTMTKPRLDMFYCIVSQKPVSLYDLAKMLDRDYSNVLRDARALSEIGIIELKSNKKMGREKLTPVALYDRIVLDFGTGTQIKPKPFQTVEKSRKKASGF